MLTRQPYKSTKRHHFRNLSLSVVRFHFCSCRISYCYLYLLISTEKIKTLTLSSYHRTQSSLALAAEALGKKMGPSCQSLVLLLAVLVLGLSLPCSDAIRINKVKTRTNVYLSPKLVLEPGSVADKYFYNINFPKGHIAIKYFNAEVIDEEGSPIPLHETYLHHWVLARYYARTSYLEPEQIGFEHVENSDFQLVRNSGLCQNNVLGQYYGLGSETRKTDTHVPDPFGIEIGNPAEIPAGYEERWMLNVHAIDTRGAVDRLGCTECRCDLYNVTKDGQGQPLRPGYKGGLYCCYDGTQCSVKQGSNGVKRSLYLRYTVKWVDWSDSIVPVKIYIFDATDRTDQSAGSSLKHDCRVEYNVEPCSTVDAVNDQCFHNQQAVITMPTGGYIVYGVAHQHTGGLGATLYREVLF
ncbi:hypothetical protein ACLB2K_051781 [Fragaria x ananassa]